MKHFFSLLVMFFSIAFQARAQIAVPNDRNAEMEEEVEDEVEIAPIDLYKIISVENDTTSVDTSLTIEKYYQFNYLRRDNFGLLPFANVGSSYNRLSYDFLEEQNVFPGFGAQARHFNFMEVEDVFYYHVPTPLTELFYKTVFEQGQILDALFTINTSENLNLSIAYKGMRSLGKYQHMLTSTGNFRTTVSYSTPNDRYHLKTHFVSQDLMNEENGGLAPSSLEQYLANNPEFEDRARLDVNFENAQSTLFGKRFYLDHSYSFSKEPDSLSVAGVSLGHTFNHTYKKYRFQQDSPHDLFGESFEQNGLRDETRLYTTKNELYLRLGSEGFGEITAKGGYTHYDYGYKSILVLENGLINNRIQGGIFSAGGAYSNSFGPLTFEAEGEINVSGDLPGYNLAADLSYLWSPGLAIAVTANINERAPNFNFLLYQSDYINYNWQNDFTNESRQSVGFQLWAQDLFDVEMQLSRFQDKAFFGSNAEGAIKPYQYDGQINYFKVQGNKEFRLGKFALDNTVLYQKAINGEDVLNVPDFVTRNTLYFSDYWFQRALFLQTGLTLNYFSSYQMNGYDPVLAEFYVQNDLEVNGFPTVDFFFNGKIKQARIFFILEHINSLVQGNNNFSAPLYPYRDFGIRFGLVWNFFM